MRALARTGVHVSQKALILTALLALLAGGLFAVWPDLDLAVAEFFFRDGRFAGSEPGERMLRRLFYYLPLLAPAAFLAAWLLARAGVALPGTLIPTDRAMIYLASTLVLAPALLVNVVLKEFSNRPRPHQIVQFGGGAEFRPWHRFDGACRSNCSFVSGEVSTSAWLVAPASLLPAPWKGPAIVAALAFAAATGALRMAFGGHFLSDVVFAILLTLLVCQALHRWIMSVPAGDRRAGSRSIDP